MRGTIAPKSAQAALPKTSREFEAECVEFFAEVVQVGGVPPSVGQIYGLLFASVRPLSFSDIVERLKMSKGSASQGLQFLRSLGAVRLGDNAPSVDGMALTRRDYFEPELSLRKLISGVLHERVAPLAAKGTDRLVRLHELATRDGGEFYSDRVRQLEIWRRRLRTVLPLLSVLLGPKSRK